MRLMIVDDSALMRRVLYDILSVDKSIEVVGSASNGEEALDTISGLQPDIVTMDINMPKMNGLTALKHIMIKNPTPVVMISAFTVEGADVTFDSLRFGAVDFITKPSKTNPEILRNQRMSVVDKVKNAADIKIDKIKHIRISELEENNKTNSDEPCLKPVFLRTATGGYSSILQIIPSLSNELDKSLIVQTNVSIEYLKPFVKYLNKFTKINIAQAEEGEYLKKGYCYINAIEHQLSFTREDDKMFMKTNLIPEHLVDANMTDVSILSYCDVVGRDAKLILLSGETGISIDGLKEIKRVGGSVYVQDPETCLMSSNIELALDNAFVDKTLNPGEISDFLTEI